MSIQSYLALWLNLNLYKLATELLLMLLLMQWSWVAVAAEAQDNPDEAFAPEEETWKLLEEGLEYGEFFLDGVDAPLTVLRIDPQKFEFVLCAAGEKDNKPKTMGQWVKQESLAAGINASMYLRDNSTSTGYMRQGNYINNGKIVNRFGAFFVAGPRKSGLPQAAIIEREHPGWPHILDEYNLVIQNYRMINSKRRVLWEPGGPRYAISAVGEDGTGKILFMHARKPVDAWSFAEEILKMPLDVRTVMYVEGGAQAGLVVNAGNFHEEIGSPHAPSFMITGNLRAVLPNILGIRPKMGSEETSESRK